MNLNRGALATEDQDLKHLIPSLLLVLNMYSDQNISGELKNVHTNFNCPYDMFLGLGSCFLTTCLSATSENSY